MVNLVKERNELRLGNALAHLTAACHADKNVGDHARLLGLHECDARHW